MNNFILNRCYADDNANKKITQKIQKEESKKLTNNKNNNQNNDHANHHSGNAKLGLTLQPLDDKLKKAFNINNNVKGLVVVDVSSDLVKSCNNKNIPQIGDSIILCENEEVNNIRTIKNIINNKNAGDIISLMLIRNNQTVKLDVKLLHKKNYMNNDNNHKISNFYKIGDNIFAELKTSSYDLRRRFRISDYVENAVIVTQTNKTSEQNIYEDENIEYLRDENANENANKNEIEEIFEDYFDRNNLEIGDIILGVNNIIIRSLDELSKAILLMKKQKKDSVALLVEKPINKEKIFISVDL